MKKLMLMSLSLAACAESADARLDHAQILAVRTEPASIAPGQRARVDVLAGDDAGNVFVTAPDTLSAIGAQGPLRVESTADGLYVTGGSAPEIAKLALSVAIDGTDWTATKSLVIGEPHDNPQVGMMIDGAEASEMLADVGSTPQLSARATGIEPFTYAWYSSVGDLKKYRQPTAELDASDAADGTVLLVVRDGAGGVGWNILPASVR
jgi:hypothetical protein